MSNLINIFFSPSQVFARLKEKPGWLMPVVIVLAVIAITTVATVYLTRDTAMAQQEEIFRERGMSDEQIEQAKQFMKGPLAAILGVISALIFTIVLLLIFSVLINVLIPAFGGKSSFKNVFSVVSHAALIRIPSSIIRMVLIIFTKSLYVSASLALLVPTMDKMSFTYRLLTGCDLFIVWEMILVALGISVTNQLKKGNAYILVFSLFILSLFIGAVLGGMGGRRT